MKSQSNLRLPLQWLNGEITEEVLDTPRQILWPLSPLLRDKTYATSSLSNDRYDDSLIEDFER